MRIIINENVWGLTSSNKMFSYFTSFTDYSRASFSKVFCHFSPRLFLGKLSQAELDLFELVYVTQFYHAEFFRIMTYLSW